MLPPCFKPLFTHLAVSQTWEHEWQSPGDCSLQRKVPKVYIWTSVSFCSFALHPCRPITLQRMFHYRFPLTNSYISHSEKKKKKKGERASTLQDKTPTDQSRFLKVREAKIIRATATCSKWKWHLCGCGKHFANTSLHSLRYTATFFSSYFTLKRGQRHVWIGGEARLRHRFRETEAHFLV